MKKIKPKEEIKKNLESLIHDSSQPPYYMKNLNSLDLKKTNLVGCDFSDTILFNAKFNEAKLSHSNFTNSELICSDFSFADLSFSVPREEKNIDSAGIPTPP